MSTCNFTTIIDQYQCISQSLETINSNTLNLDNALTSLSARIAGYSNFGVRNVIDGQNIKNDITNRIATVNENICPTWYSNYQYYSDVRFTKHINDTISANPVSPHNGPLITFSSTTGKTTTVLEGGIMMADGRIYCVARSGDATTCIYDPKFDTFTAAAGPGDSKIYSSGGVLLPDGRLFLVPSTTDISGKIYDPVTNKVSEAAKGNTFWKTGVDYPFYTCTLLPDGRVYINPNGYSQALIYDWANDRLTQSDSSTPVTKGSYSCCLLDTGEVLRVTNRSGGKQAWLYNHETNKFRPIDPPPNDTLGCYFGCIKLQNGNVLMIPDHNQRQRGRIYNPYTGELTETNFSGFFYDSAHPDLDAYYGGSVLLPDGRVLITPWKADSFIIWDPNNDTNDYWDISDPVSPNKYSVTNIKIPNTTGVGYLGTFLLENGKVFCIPNPKGTNGLLISPFVQKNFSLNVLTSPRFNKLY